MLTEDFLNHELQRIANTQQIYRSILRVEKGDSPLSGHVPKLVEIHSGYPRFMFGFTVNQRSNYYEFEESMFPEHGEVTTKRITQAFLRCMILLSKRRFA